MAKELSLAEFKEARYKSLTKMIGEKMARYTMCAVFNVMFDPLIDCVDFEDYCEQTQGKKFKDGQIKLDEEREISREQMEKWVKTWGIGDSSKPYTEDDYKALDNKFEVYSARLEKSGGMDEQQEDTLRTCSRMRHEADKYFVKGGKENIDMASKLNKMVQDMLASEQLRKVDEKPVTLTRWDGITDIIAKKYGTDVEMSYDEAKDIIAEWMTSHKYPMTMDAAEHMYLAIVNNARLNDDLPEISELPEEMKIPQELSDEFAKESNQEEKEAYDYLSIKKFGAPKL